MQIAPLDTPVGVPGSGFTVTVIESHSALRQPVVVLCARAKYVVVACGDTLSGEPVPTSEPVQEPVYHSTSSPDPTVAVSPNDCPSQIVPPDPAVGVAGSEFTVTVTVAHSVLTHPVVVFRARA